MQFLLMQYGKLYNDMVGKEYVHHGPTKLDLGMFFYDSSDMFRPLLGVEKGL